MFTASQCEVDWKGDNVSKHTPFTTGVAILPPLFSNVIALFSLFLCLTLPSHHVPFKYPDSPFACTAYGSSQLCIYISAREKCLMSMSWVLLALIVVYITWMWCNPWVLTVWRQWSESWLPPQWSHSPDLCIALKFLQRESSKTGTMPLIYHLL